MLSEHLPCPALTAPESPDVTTHGPWPKDSPWSITCTQFCPVVSAPRLLHSLTATTGRNTWSLLMSQRELWPPAVPNSCLGPCSTPRSAGRWMREHNSVGHNRAHKMERFVAHSSCPFIMGHPRLSHPCTVFPGAIASSRGQS